MFNSFPYDEWSETITDFWTWGGHNSTGTFIQLALGLLLFIVAMIGWVVMEKGKLERQAQRLLQGPLSHDPVQGPTGMD